MTRRELRSPVQGPRPVRGQRGRRAALLRARARARDHRREPAGRAADGALRRRAGSARPRCCVRASLPASRRWRRRNVEERGHPEFVVVVFDAWSDDPVAGASRGGARRARGAVRLGAARRARGRVAGRDARRAGPTRSRATSPRARPGRGVLPLPRARGPASRDELARARHAARPARARPSRASVRTRSPSSTASRGGSRTCSRTTCGSTISTATPARDAIVKPVERYNELRRVEAGRDRAGAGRGRARRDRRGQGRAQASTAAGWPPARQRERAHRSAVPPARPRAASGTRSAPQARACCGWRRSQRLGGARGASCGRICDRARRGARSGRASDVAAERLPLPGHAVRSEDRARGRRPRRVRIGRGADGCCPCSRRSGASASSAPVDGGGADGARYEIFHDVLAEAVLAWRREQELERERRTAAQRHRRLLALSRSRSARRSRR